MLFYLSFKQRFVVSIVVHMVSVNQDVVGVILAGPEVFVINYLVIQDAQNMDSVKMERVFVHKDGMDDIAHYVSFFSDLFFYILYLFMIVLFFVLLMFEVFLFFRENLCFFGKSFFVEGLFMLIFCNSYLWIYLGQITRNVYI